MIGTLALRRAAFAPLLRVLAACAACGAVLGLASNAIAQRPGPNINMVSGMTLPDGDPFLQRQNEPSIAVSTRNPCHLLAGANDYRTVDLPGLPADMENGDARLGLFKSFDCGKTWNVARRARAGASRGIGTASRAGHSPGSCDANSGRRRQKRRPAGGEETLGGIPRHYSARGFARDRAASIASVPWSRSCCADLTRCAGFLVPGLGRCTWSRNSAIRSQRACPPRCR